jgi:hypothetical protein
MAAVIVEKKKIDGIQEDNSKGFIKNNLLNILFF